MTALLSIGLSQVQLPREGLSSPSYQTQPVPPSKSVPELILLPTFSPYLHVLTPFDVGHLEKGILWSLLSNTVSTSPQTASTSTTRMDFHAVFHPSLICLLSERFSVPSYQMQPVTSPRNLVPLLDKTGMLFLTPSHVTLRR